MKTALSRLATLVTNDVLTVAREVQRHRRPPSSASLNGIEIEFGPWASPEVRWVIHAGLYESPERDVVLASLRSDDVVLELGTGSGYITTIAAGIAREVRSFDANPELVPFARATVARNGRAAAIENAVLTRAPGTETVPFYLNSEFWTSSLLPFDGAREIAVPVFDFDTVRAGCSYLITDIEGGELELLSGDLTGIRAVCVECHPSVLSTRQITDMLSSLFAQGFTLDLGISRGQVLYLSRD
jgi:FkbM family methyltransferase